jgi:hypothetical protein
VVDLICAITLYFIWKSDMKYWSEHLEDPPKTPEGWIPPDKELYRIFGYNYYIYHAKRGKDEDDGSNNG